MASPPPAGQLPIRTILGCLAAVGGVVVVVLALQCGGLALLQHQQNNQIAPVLPPGTPPPVIPAMPDITAALRQGKTVCEGRVGEVKAAAKLGKVRPKEMQHGRGLYTNAQAASDGCISFLQSGLARRFTERDPKDAQAKLDAANEAMMDFTLWAEAALHPQGVGAVGPWGEAANMLSGWIKALQGQNDQNDRALEMLRSDLEQCRLRDWDKIGGD